MKLKITCRGIKITEALKQKIDKLVKKHEGLLKNAIKLEFILTGNKSSKKNKEQSSAEFLISMPKVVLSIEKKGTDLYSLIDEIDPLIKRKLVQYNDSFKRWQKNATKTLLDKQWEMEDTYEQFEDSDLTEKILITRHKQFSQNYPMHPIEAIEKMELLGHEAFLFKNIETKKYAAVYKKKDGTYGLIEPKD